MTEMYIYFKLFNNIKSEHEAKDFARMELESLFGNVTPIHNMIEVATEKPLSNVLNATFEINEEELRLADILTHELPYGKYHGYYGVKKDIIDITKLVKRLGYTKEIIVVIESDKAEYLLESLFSNFTLNRNIQFTSFNGYSIFRFITHQFFLEKSQYITKLSRNEEEVRRNVNLLFRYPIYDFYRIPASSTMRIGKRLEDYFAIREEPSLYITHYMHPYKGKFHPKMVRAILNYIYPEERGKILDNFAGSGTLLVEGILLGLDSYGIEINPLSVLMTNVKTHSLKRIDTEKLKGEFSDYLKKIEKNIDIYLNMLTKVNQFFRQMLMLVKFKKRGRLYLWI